MRTTARLRRSRGFVVFGVGEFVEVAALAFGGLVLVDELEAARVELVEPFVPGDLFERAVVGVGRARKLQTNDPGLSIAAPGGLSAGYNGGASAALFGPAANLVVVASGFR